MSKNWLSAGLRTLKNYFGGTGDEDEDEDESSMARALETNTAIVSTSGKRKAAAVGGGDKTLQPQQVLFAGQDKKRRKKRHADVAGKGQVVPKKATANEQCSLDPHFKAKLDALKAFKAKNGHLNISSCCSEKDKTLYYFINYQRKRRQAFPHRYHRNRAMTQAEIDALDAIGFDWGRAAASPQTGTKSMLKSQSLEDAKVEKLQHPKIFAIARADRSSAGKDDELDPNFKASLEKLEAAIEEHGHMNFVYATDPYLYRFVQRQRARRHAWPKRYGTNRVIKQAEIDALDRLGFDWGSTVGVAETGSSYKSVVALPPQQQSSPTVAKGRDDQSDEKEEFLDAKMPAVEHTGPLATRTYGTLSPQFEAKLNELKAFIDQHGHMDVRFNTIKNDRALYDWIRKQRLRLEALPNRYMHYSPMTQAEFDALDAIGFDWAGTD